MKTSNSIYAENKEFSTKERLDSEKMRKKATDTIFKVRNSKYLTYYSNDKGESWI